MEFAKSEIASSDVSGKHVAVIIPDYYMIQQLADIWYTMTIIIMFISDMTIMCFI